MGKTLTYSAINPSIDQVDNSAINPSIDQVDNRTQSLDMNERKKEDEIDGNLPLGGAEHKPNSNCSLYVVRYSCDVTDAILIPLPYNE
jgi:hypothetical protein